jgi:hypothetical protein
MTYFNWDTSTALMLLFLVAMTIGLFFLLKFLLNPKYTKKKAAMSNNKACKKAAQEDTLRRYTDYFWTDYMRAAWIMLFLAFFIALGFAITTPWSIFISVLLIIVTLYFILFAMKSYTAFPIIAKERLDKFEAQVNAALEKEISFNGDNIQSFSDEDDAFDTKPQTFSFPATTTKIPFPPFEKDAKKQPIIATKKLEFLILSREYFSICKGAATFDLLNPKRGPLAKQCAEVAGSAGECNEHYYSQMRNVEYDGTKECIRIIYYDERDDVEFSCKKAAPNRKPAMKALKEKLRLTERQRLRKIDEHEKYEEIVNRRKDDHEDTDIEDDENKE